MGRKSSIHIQPVKSNSEKHNTREVDPDYTIKDNELKNRNYSNISESIESRRENIEKLYNEKVGQKMQSKATPIREGVVVLDEKHFGKDKKNPDIEKAKEHIEKLSKDLKDKYKIETFQYHIHMDEGKDKDNLNYHAHLVMDMQNKETGRMVHLNKKQMAELQTEVAKSLGMERGQINSKAERLEHGEYRQKISELNASLKILEEQKKNVANEVRTFKEKFERTEKEINKIKFPQNKNVENMTAIEKEKERLKQLESEKENKGKNVEKDRGKDNDLNEELSI